MTHERDIERLLDHWFSDGPSQAPDRVLDAVADRIGRQSQRPAWRLDRRPFQMSSMFKFATALAAVGIVAVLGFGLFRFASDWVGSPPAPLFEVVARYDPATLGLDRPVALAIGPNGDAYVTESSDRVTQITPDGVVVRRWGTTGSGPGQFDFNARTPTTGRTPRSRSDRTARCTSRTATTIASKCSLLTGRSSANSARTGRGRDNSGSHST